MEFLTALERCSDELTPVERRLTETLLAAPGEAAFLSVQELSQRAGADAAAAVRLARKLGYSGYRQLKSSLQAGLLNASEAHSRLEKRVRPMRDDGVLADLVANEISSLGRLRDQVSEARIADTAATLRDARHVVVYGQGHATALADLMTRRLNRHGYRAAAIREGQWSAPEAVAHMTADDVLVVFALYRMPDTVSLLLAHAANVGARSVLITDQVGLSPVAPPTHMIAASRGRPGESHTLGVPMLLVNAILMALARIDEGRSFAALARLDEVTRMFAAGQKPAARKKRQSETRQDRQQG